MKEGWWINYRQDKKFPVDEHEMWLREGSNAKKLGISPDVIKDFAKFKRVTDRDKFLVYVMQNAPVMRVRGHGLMTTFEYHSRQRSDPLDAVWMFAKRFLGPLSQINVHNLATGEFISVTKDEFDELAEKGYESVMRAASKYSDESKAMIRELILAAKEIVEGETPSVDQRFGKR